MLWGGSVNHAEKVAAIEKYYFTWLNIKYKVGFILCPVSHIYAFGFDGVP